ncbi:hypothetical protein BC567DRAFT_145347, partial [Phyllosticta citribraziliensis]
DAWVRKIRNSLREIGSFALKQLNVQTTGGDIKVPPQGAFHATVGIIIDGGGELIIRIPKPAWAMFPEEKTPIEAATMQFIKAKTSVPVPKVFDWGTREQGPCNFGPFIIMERIGSEKCFHEVLQDHSREKGTGHKLDPDLPDETLRKSYSQLAGILVELSKPTAERIGSLVKVGDEWEVKHRPLTCDLNDLVHLGGLPRAKAESETFSSSTSFFQFLAHLHLEHLIHQRNDAIKDAEDCRRKYVARKLFIKLAEEDKLSWPDSSTFRLWNDDLRPHNVLTDDELNVKAVIDWDFTYFAPPEYTYSPPWWLLLDVPELWDNGVEDWTAHYEGKLEIFLDELQKVEDDGIANGQLEHSQRLSERMRKCWEDGDFWVFYAARKSFAFDTIFWYKICPRFFGFGADEWQKGVELLGNELKGMEEVVEKKVKEMET